MKESQIADFKKVWCKSKTLGELWKLTERLPEENLDYIFHTLLDTDKLIGLTMKDKWLLSAVENELKRRKEKRYAKQLEEAKNEYIVEVGGSV